MSLTITYAVERGKTKGWVLVLTSFLAILACWTAPVAAEEAAPLVFIHGIKGSELVNDKGAVQWVTATQALGFSTPDLALEARFEDGRQPLGTLQPGKILARIDILPVLIGVDIYGPWLKVAGSWGKPFYQFSYDWRRDNLETMATFVKFLESVKARHGGRKVQVVGHSMGGMIALAAMNRSPELFDRVVFAGSPFGGGIGFLPDLHQGTSTGLNDAIAGPEVVKTFSSVYSFFPERPGNLVDASGAVLAADFFTPEDWKRLKIGMYAEGRDPGEGFVSYLTEALGRAKKFRQLLQPDPSRGALPPVLVVAGKKFQTLHQAVQGGTKSELGWDFESAAKVPGDGRVAFVNAMPPEGIPYKVFETSADHTDLLSDPLVQKAIEDFLTD